MSRHVNSLDDDCLIAIFGHLPLCDLLRINEVCHRWAVIQSIVYATKTTLVLLDSQLAEHERFRDSYAPFALIASGSFRCLQLCYLSPEIAHKLVDTFPNVSRLEIIQSDLGAVLPQVLYLLEQWANRLETLSVMIGSQFSSVYWLESVSWLPVLEAIDYLPQLRNLTLLDKMRLPRDAKLPDLRRLEELNYGLSFESFDGVFEQLKDCTSLRRLTLSTEMFPIPSDHHLSQLTDLLASQLTHLALLFRPQSNEAVSYLQIISSRMHSLTRLHLLFDYPLATLALYLSPLRHLTSLRLEYQPGNFLNHQSRNSNWKTSNGQLSTVRRLHLDCTNTSSILPHICSTPPNQPSCFDVIHAVFPRLSSLQLHTLAQVDHFCIACNQNALAVARSCLNSLKSSFPNLNQVTLPRYLSLTQADKNDLSRFDTNHYLAQYQVHHLQKNGVDTDEQTNNCTFRSIEL